MKFILILLFCLFSAPIYADTYKCTDPNGKITYSSDPCIGKQKSTIISINAGKADNLNNHEEEQKPQELTPESNAPVPGQVAVPKLVHRVTDLTATLNKGQIKTLEAKLAAFEAKKGSQIAVLILPTTQSEDIADFSLRVAKTWKIGRENINDGVILIVAKKDRKLRIEVGRGLEQVIPDAMAQSILSNTIKPYFKSENYVGGIDAGVAEVMSLIDRQPLPVSNESSLPPPVANDVSLRPEQIAVPVLSRRVTDLTATLNNQQIETLEAKLATFETKNGSQIAVLILPTTQPEDIADFSLRVAKTWKIGRKNINDGVILVVAKKDRTLRLEVGRGLAQVIPDAMAQSILAKTIKPRFKGNDFVGGIEAGITQLMALIAAADLAKINAKTESTPIQSPASVIPGEISKTNTPAPATAPPINLPKPIPEEKSFIDELMDGIREIAMYFFNLLVWIIVIIGVLGLIFGGSRRRQRHRHCDHSDSHCERQSIFGNSGSSNNDSNSRFWGGGGGGFSGSGASDSWGSDGSSSSESSNSGGGDGGGASDSW